MDIKINIIKNKILSKNHFFFHKITYELIQKNGKKIFHKHEVYNRGNSATILLYNHKKRNVVLVRQFRVATWLNNNPDGMLIEACAGLLDKDEPEVCIRKEVIEETGFSVKKVQKIFDLYMSPGSTTEIVHFFIAEYTENLHSNISGGTEDEYIEVLEIPFSKALKMVKDSKIRDGKTVILLQYLYYTGIMK